MAERLVDFVKATFPHVSEVDIGLSVPLMPVSEEDRNKPTMSLDDIYQVIHNENYNGPNVLTNDRNVVASSWRPLLRLLKLAMAECPSDAAKISFPTDVSDLRVVTRDDFNKAFVWSLDDPDVRKAPVLYVRTYRIAFGEPAFDLSEVAAAVRNGPGPRFAFEALTEEHDDDATRDHYLQESIAKSRAFVAAMGPVVKLVAFLHGKKLYLNSVRDVFVDDAGNVTMSRLENVTRTPTMDLDTVCALALYDDLTREEGDEPYELLWELYAASPLSQMAPVPEYEPASAGLPEISAYEKTFGPGWARPDQTGGGSHYAAWAALAAVAFVAAALK